MIQVHVYDTETGVNNDFEWDSREVDYMIFLSDGWTMKRDVKSRNKKRLKLLLRYETPAPVTNVQRIAPQPEILESE